MKVTFSGGRALERALRELGSLRRVKSALTRSGMPRGSTSGALRGTCARARTSLLKI